MATIQIPDDLAAQLQEAATYLGRTKDDLLYEAVSLILEERSAPEQQLTPQQIEHMKESVAQLKRGEFITEKEVDAFFDKLHRDLEAD